MERGMLAIPCKRKTVSPARAVCGERAISNSSRIRMVEGSRFMGVMALMLAGEM